MKKQISTILQAHKGISARAIAVLLERDKSEINSILYKFKGSNLAYKNESHLWFWGVQTDSKTYLLSEKQDPSTKNKKKPTKLPMKFSPTSEQKPVIEAPTKARLFVEAGPGTGKTESLVSRIKFLFSSEGLNPSQVLVLSFSVAAVKELKKRAKAQGDASDLNFVEFRTFDSFASRFLRQIIPSDELSRLNYDERILRATDELKNNSSAARLVESFRHVFLDEMQDLVGVRAEFAFELLNAVKPGFTLFGDSAQGIYDFTIEDGPSQTTSRDLVDLIRENFSDLNERHRFTLNHRVSGNEHLETLAHKGRTLLLESPQKAWDYLQHELGSLADHGSTGKPNICQSLLDGSTCVVCRTNGQVFRLAGELLKAGIPFQLSRDKNEFLPPAWLGRVFFNWQDDPIRKKPFVDRAMSILGVDENVAGGLWAELLAACGSPRSVSFSLADLRSALIDGIALPENDLYPRNNDVIHLSTIHRSKGREFGNVIVVMNDKSDSHSMGRAENKVDDEAEPRVLFVALTRARNTVHRMSSAARGIWLPDQRWLRTFSGDNGFVKLSSIQVGIERDINHESFAYGSFEDVEESQNWLLKNALPGSRVELWLEESDSLYPRYKIMLSNVLLGYMSENFGKSVYYTLKDLNRGNPKRFPVRISGIWVKEIITAVGNLSSDEVDSTLRTSGLWMSLALGGLGNCEWK